MYVEYYCRFKETLRQLQIFIFTIFLKQIKKCEPFLSDDPGRRLKKPLLSESILPHRYICISISRALKQVGPKSLFYEIRRFEFKTLAVIFCLWMLSRNLSNLVNFRIGIIEFLIGNLLGIFLVLFFKEIIDFIFDLLHRLMFYCLCKCNKCKNID